MGTDSVCSYSECGNLSWCYKCHCLYQGIPSSAGNGVRDARWYIPMVNVADKVIVALKVASYALTNRDLRDMYLESVPTPTEYESAPYPENINLSNLLYFWWAPTLIYQPVYPHTANFRLGFFLKRSGEAVGILIALWFIIAQYAMFHSQIIKFNQLDPSSITRSLRLTNSISPKSSNES